MRAASILLASVVLGAVVLGQSPSPAPMYQYVTISDAMRQTAQAIVTESAKTTTAYDRLGYLTDTFGPRFSGSAGLEQAIDWLAQTAASDGFTVTQQPVMVPKWVRGNEWAKMLSPRNKTLHFVGLGMSNSTMGQVITAPVIVVTSFDDLNSKGAAQVAGKIVLFNVPFTSYGVTVAYRVQGAVAAAALGAVGCLIRSVAPWGLQTPHTGSSITTSIPAGAVSFEDAAQMARMQARGQPIVVSMYMEAQFYPDSPSRNLIIDYPGSQYPDEYVVLGGHVDSWDIAEGGSDDGGGILASLEALRLVKAAGIKPLRTLRCVHWVNEENGGRGGTAYATQPLTASTLPKTSIAMESDEGAFSPYSLAFSGSDAAYNQLTLLAPLLDLIGAGNVTRVPSSPGADIAASCATDTDFPCGGLETLDPRATPSYSNNACDGFVTVKPGEQPQPRVSGISDGYFWTHHTAADTLERMDPAQLQVAAASLAIWATAIANLPTLLPRNVPAPPLPGPKPGPISRGAVAGIIIAVAVISAATIGVFVLKRRGYFSRWSGNSSGGPRLSPGARGVSYTAMRTGSVGAIGLPVTGASEGAGPGAPLFAANNANAANTYTHY